MRDFLKKLNFFSLNQKMYNSKEKQNKQNKRKMNTQNVNVIVDEIDSGYSSSSSSVVVSKSSLNKYGNYTDIKEFASKIISDANI